jgi:hypothetical protein
MPFNVLSASAAALVSSRTPEPDEPLIVRYERPADVEIPGLAVPIPTFPAKYAFPVVVAPPEIVSPVVCVPPPMVDDA